MEVSGITCRGCGSSDVVFDPVTRKIHCNQCGKEEYYSRAQLGATGKVAIQKDNAIKFFKAGNFRESRNFAEDVLNIIIDSVEGLFIVAYCDEFELGKNGSLMMFFNKVNENNFMFERDEVINLMDLFTSALHNMVDFEDAMITVIVKNFQDQEDRGELSEYIDTICPYCINHRSSSDFLSREKVGLYQDLAEHLNIPKTCFALLSGINKNPDSPYVTNSFNMKNHTRYFMDNYVTPVGLIIQDMSDSQYKSKFISAYQSAVNDYKSKMGS
jgi:hypothetical protein